MSAVQGARLGLFRLSRSLLTSRPAFTRTLVEDPQSHAIKAKEAKSIKFEDAIGSSDVGGGLITVDGVEEISLMTGMPEEHKERTVRIYKPAKNAMQSGTAGIKRWKIEWENRERWENPLMGWSSSADPLSNLLLDFADKEEAIAFCEKNAWDYVLEDPKERAPKVKAYANNFAWNKRTRKSCK